MTILYRLALCLKCHGDLAYDQGDWLCLHCAARIARQPAAIAATCRHLSPTNGGR